jgi:sugar transferase
VTLAFYMFWICLVLIAHAYLFYHILPVGHSRTVKLFRANRIVVAMGDRRLERPKFVDALRQEVSYYNLRHSIRPGITGWARIRYNCRSSVDDAKEKLRSDLFYIKNVLAWLDSLVFLQTIKVILWARGAK